MVVEEANTLEKEAQWRGLHYFCVLVVCIRPPELQGGTLGVVVCRQRGVWEGCSHR